MEHCPYLFNCYCNAKIKNQSFHQLKHLKQYFDRLNQVTHIMHLNFILTLLWSCFIQIIHIDVQGFGFGSVVFA